MKDFVASTKGTEVKYYQDKIEEFEKSKPSEIDSDWFPYYVDHKKLVNWRNKAPDLPDALASWDFQYTDIETRIDIYNFQDRLELWMTKKLPDGKKSADYQEEIEGFIKRNKYKKATETLPTSLFGGSYAGVKAVFAYDGKTKGKDIMENYFEMYSYGKRMRKIFD
jgi:hypothetical protein